MNKILNTNKKLVVRRKNNIAARTRYRRVYRSDKIKKYKKMNKREKRAPEKLILRFSYRFL